MWLGDGGLVNIRCCGNGFLGFRPYGESPFPNAEKVTEKACSCVRPARWGSGFLRCGIDPGASPPVCFAAPPLDVFGCAKRSLRSHPRINPSSQPSDVARVSRSRSRASPELALIVLSGERRRRCAVCAECGVRCFALAFLWERACSRRRPDSRPISSGFTGRLSCRSFLGVSAHNW